MLIFLPSERDGGTENTMKKKVIMIFLVAVLAMAAFSCARSEDDHGSENLQSESAYSDAENSSPAAGRTAVPIFPRINRTEERRKITATVKKTVRRRKR